MDKYNVSEIYTMVNNERVKIKSLAYTLTRTAAPIYVLGSPPPYHKRSLAGTFSISVENYKKIKNKLDVCIDHYESNQTILLKNLEIVQEMYDSEEGHWECAFLAQDLDTTELQKLGEMTNRQLAGILLEGEY